MSPIHFLRSSAVALGVGVAAACLPQPAFADTPIAVTFAANSVWAQEIGTLNHSDNSIDYTVAVGAGKTLQLNLLSRNPNVHFKVKDETNDKKLLDSRKTGESTWSTQNATATTYTIQVYIETAAIGSEETTKFALQVGQYGAADMQPPTTAVTFEANKPWAQQAGSLAAGATAHNFTVSIAAGMTVKINLLSSNPQLHFKVSDQTQNKQVVDTSTTGTSSWTDSVTTATNYMIQVYADPSALPAGQSAQYNLQVGQYASGNAQPAAAGTAAAPASTPATSP